MHAARFDVLKGSEAPVPMTSDGRQNLRSVPCNGELMRFFRERRGWTQDELASRAGYSKRAIAKAEAGGSLHPDTVEVLAETLSTAVEVVYVEDLLASPKALAKRFIETYRHYEHELAARCKDFLADDMVCIVGGDDRSVPLSGRYEGPDGFDSYCRKFSEIFQRPNKEFFQPKLVADGNHVVAMGWEYIQLKCDPKELIGRGGWLVVDMHFSRGKLVHLELLFDTTGFGEAVTQWREFEQAQQP